MGIEAYLFQSERLGFRNWKQTDLHWLERLNADKEVMKHFPKTLNKQESRELLERLITYSKAYGYTFWVVEILESKEPAGFIGLKNFNFQAFFSPGIEIGWRIFPQFWNKGLATEGAKRVLQWAREKNLGKIYSFTPHSNLASQRVMQKSGMTFIDFFNHPLLENGHPLQKCILFSTM